MNAIVNIPAKNVLAIAVYSSFLKTVTKMASSLFSVALGQKRKEIQEVNILRHPTANCKLFDVAKIHASSN